MNRNITNWLIVLGVISLIGNLDSLMVFASNSSGGETKIRRAPTRHDNVDLRSIVTRTSEIKPLSVAVADLAASLALTYGDIFRQTNSL